MAAVEQDDRVIDPMIYDALLELATRISGRYLAWARAAGDDETAVRWRAAGIEVRRQVREVDPESRSAIEAKRTELRELWASMPETAPVLAA